MGVHTKDIGRYVPFLKQGKESFPFKSIVCVTIAGKVDEQGAAWLFTIGQTLCFDRHGKRPGAASLKRDQDHEKR
jgi:hypothetical protein